MSVIVIALAWVNVVVTSIRAIITILNFGILPERLLVFTDRVDDCLYFG